MSDKCSSDADQPDSDAFRIPTIREIDEMRVDLGLSQAELSRRAGFEKDRFNGILYNGYDPHTSTLRAFLEAIQEAEPKCDEEIDRTGPKPKPSKSVDQYERLCNKLEAIDPDELGDDPSPPDPDGRLVTDGGCCVGTAAERLGGGS